MLHTVNADYIAFRAFSYDLFRRLLIEEPTPELLRFLQQFSQQSNSQQSNSQQPILQQQTLSALFSLLPQQDTLSLALNNIERYLASHQFIAGETTFEDLHWDFTRLFIGPETPLAPPWESVYSAKDGLLFQETTQSVQQRYAQQGFTLAESEYEAADHIGFELDFMYQQSLFTAQHIEQLEEHESLITSLQLQYDFLTQHLLPFSVQFCQRIQTSANTTFYRDFSTVLQQFLNHDQQQLQTMIELMTE